MRRKNLCEFTYDMIMKKKSYLIKRISSNICLYSDPSSDLKASKNNQYKNNWMSVWVCQIVNIDCVEEVPGITVNQRWNN